MVSLLKRNQMESVFSVLPSIDVFPIRYGNSIIYQISVMPKSCLVSDVNNRAVAFVISPLKHCWRTIEGF
jgi:hypothetical protein